MQQPPQLLHNCRPTSEVEEELAAKNQKLLTISRAYQTLREQLKESQQQNSILQSEIQQLKEEKLQLKMVMRHHEESHQKKINLMLPGEKELEEAREKIKELEKERDEKLLPEIQRLSAGSKYTEQSHEKMKKGMKKYEKYISNLEEEMRQVQKKSQVTMALQEETNKQMRRKNARMFGELVKKKKDIDSIKQAKIDDAKRIEELEGQVQKLTIWQDRLKDQMRDERKTMYRSQQKSLKLESNLKQEWMDARERESLISQLTEENLYLKHKARLLEDKLTLLPPPECSHTETLFYKHVKDQLANLSQNLNLSSVEAPPMDSSGEYVQTAQGVAY